MRKSATYDEPVHATAGFINYFFGDYRANPEDPPLWKYWAMLPHGPGDLRPDFSSPAWKAMASDTEPWQWFSVPLLYRDAGIDGAAFINRSRLMMLLVGLALGVAIMTWSWQLAGPAAAVVAGVLYCFDPGFLAHAPLVKNDVLISLLLFFLIFLIYRLGRRITVTGAALAGLVCGMGPAVKFSGLIFCLILPAALLVRALLPSSWPFSRHELRGRRQRLLAAGAICLVSAVITWGVIWMSYRCRFDPSPIQGQRLNIELQTDTITRKEFQLEHGRDPTAAELLRLPRPFLARAALWAERHRLVPQAWLHGLLYIYHSTLLRPGFLLGRIKDGGWWYYFPLVVLFKTPLATLAACAGAAGCVILLALRRRLTIIADDPWAAICIALPLSVYGYSAVTSNLNLGLRHVLPLYPFFYVAVAVVVVSLGALRPRLVCGMAAMLAAGLIAETLLAFPDYIPFFNAAAGGSRGGLRLLSDSNLDWGQDLPLLARWQRQNPDKRLYLCYFGTPDPAFYGITYTNLPSGYFLGPEPEMPSAPGVIAVSATKLQGLYVYPGAVDFYAYLRRLPVRQVLGGSIYLYDYPLPGMALPR